MQLVLINISDHHTRTKVNAPPDQRSMPARVVGCLLGQQSGRSVSIRNSFEVGNSFPEDANQLDFGFLHKKLEQCKYIRILKKWFKKTNERKNVVPVNFSTYPLTLIIIFTCR
jgi:JAB1/Mov34/MPN/PAD-1 ubiquitin protease